MIFAKKHKGPDGYVVSKSDPDFKYHVLISAHIEQLNPKTYWVDTRLSNTEAGNEISELGPDECRLAALAALSRVVIIDSKDVTNLPYMRGARSALRGVIATLLRRNLDFNSNELERFIDWQLNADVRSHMGNPLGAIVDAVERYSNEHELSESLKAKLAKLTIPLSVANRDSVDQKVAFRIRKILSDGIAVLLQPGEAWTDYALKELETLDDETQCHWSGLLEHCMSASASKPSKRWQKKAEDLVQAIGADEFNQHVTTWFGLADKPGSQPGDPDLYVLQNSFHVDILKGLVWCASTCGDQATIRAITALALSAYKKLPGIGPRCIKLGNACIYALGQIDDVLCVGQLALLKVKVKFIPAQKGIAKALNAAAERMGVSKDEVEEIGVPTYGMSECGVLTRQLGDATAQIVVTGSTTTKLVWLKEDAKGKVKEQKSVPAHVKKDHTDELKELKATAKDMQKMLSAQKERIDNLYLQRREWDYKSWKERYLDHPLMGVISRKLVWSFETDGTTHSGLYSEGQIVDQDGNALDDLNDSSRVTLWHPIGKALDEILAWRNWLDEHELSQPFKQAYREVYLLTDAERNTRVYSNRFAAHIVKQHQFIALCRARGWKGTLQLLVDDTFPPPEIELHAWGLRAEFWVDGIGENYGDDTNEAGVFHYLTTDQVRFYDIEEGRISNDPKPIEEIPALVLSEILRDADLFVGVASVGNDPEWQDGGPDAQYREYWHSYSFGDLNASAKTRKAVLERLIPRLKIADRCELTDKFLVVRGEIHTYKIHLGSGNILISPKDQYLCIVQGRGAVKGPAAKVFLPFEGDRTLSIILSKAFLLAEDKKITDKTILSQL